NAGLAVTMPIYSGGTARARIGQAQAVLEQRKADIELRRQSLVLAVHSAMLATQDAANRLQVTRKSIEQAGEALRVAQEKYNAGLGSSTEVIDTQVALVQAETNYANALYDGKIAVAQLDYAVGRDPKTAETASSGGLNR
ncbi:MAG: TolC family protein, partial [bacterium]|nr:TolC family protein [bacterium]